MTFRIDPETAAVLIRLGLLAEPVVREVAAMVRGLIRADLDPPWAVGVAMWTVRTIAEDYPGESAARQEERARVAIHQYLASAGARPTPEDIDKLYSQAVAAIRRELGLDQPAPETAPNTGGGG